MFGIRVGFNKMNNKTYCYIRDAIYIRFWGQVWNQSNVQVREQVRNKIRISYQVRYHVWCQVNHEF